MTIIIIIVVVVVVVVVMVYQNLIRYAKLLSVTLCVQSKHFLCLEIPF